MNKVARYRIPAMLALPVVLLTFAFVACAGNEGAREDVPTATGASETSSTDSPPAEPAAETQDTARTSLDDYLMAVCGPSETTAWEEGVSLGKISSGLEQFMEILESLEPPSEVSDWHEATLGFGRAFKKNIDDYLEDPKGQSEEEFLLSNFVTMAPHFQPVEQAIAGMDPDVRSQMVEAGCIDEETSGATPTQQEREEISVGDSLAGSLEPRETDIFQFQAEAGVEYVIEVAWQDMPEITVIVKDAPNPVANSFQTRWSETSPLVVRWVAELSDAHHIDIFSGKGTGSYTVSLSIDTRPASPAGVSAAWEGSAVRVSWEPVEGAEYYNVYYDTSTYSCSLDGEGNSSFCKELAANVVDTSYTHASPDALFSNHYWVVACSSDGCSEIDSLSPATPGESDVDTVPTPTETATTVSTPTPTAEPEPTPQVTPTPTVNIPSAPANVRYEFEGSSILVLWDSVDDADYYNVYHDNFFDDKCSVDRSGTPQFCSELASDITGTTYSHSGPDSIENHYWVVACNSDGCSEVDSENPAKPAFEAPDAPTDVTFARSGSTIIVTWAAVSGADYYRVFHDSFFDDNCSLGLDGTPSFCSELASNVTGTRYEHTDPDEEENYYWVIACNRGGCSEVDSENPAKPE